MCSIMGCFGTEISIEKFKECFDRTVSRGPDMSRIIEMKGGIIGFHRLSIMGLDEKGMQPFSYKDKKVVCNGEIYGFRPLKKELENEGYKFAGESDCEIILPLYEKYGTDMFAMLDAEYALIILPQEIRSVYAHCITDIREKELFLRASLKT